ncbi:hypothetical protein QS429_13515 [Staphylococcus pseudintermedius]|nr:hypothetical protein QS429_13515 [Staphylococcus pseudintermedius]
MIMSLKVPLHELDKELEKRGHRFVRYADDFVIFVRTKRAGERVMNAHFAQYFSQITKKLLDGSYQPQAVRKVQIPKPNGKIRRKSITSNLYFVLNIVQSFGTFSLL